MKNISILGSGWLGLPLALELAKTNNIKLSTTTASKKRDLIAKNITPYIVNTNDTNDEIKEFLNCNTLIINIPSKDIKAFEILIKQIEKQNIKDIIFVSSTSAYNNPKSPLGNIEELFLSLQKINTTILRFGGLIGYSRNPANFFKNGKVVKNSHSSVNMIHRDDCIAIIKKVLESDIKNEIFNCCSPSHPPKKEFYTYCANTSNLAIPNFDSSDEESNARIISSDKLISKLKYKFIHDDLMKVRF